MKEVRAGLRGRWRAVLEVGIFLVATVCGYFSLPVTVSVLGLSAALLFVSDKGQHKDLADRFPGRPRAQVVALSVGAFFGLNVIALLACYSFGLGLARFFAPEGFV